MMFFVATKDRIDELLALVEAEPDVLRELEFAQTQERLETLIGKTVVKAEIEQTRIVITTADGEVYSFYGFLGGEPSPTTQRAANNAPT